MTSFSIIIPNFNGVDYLGKCLESILSAVKLSPENKYEFIMVDNGSVDNSVNLFSNLLPQNIDSKVILLGKNTGFANAVNQGVLAAKYDYVVITNNDLTLDKNWFKIITKEIKNHPKVACFCGTVLNQKGTLIESQGINFDYSGKCILLNHNQNFIVNCKLKIENCFVWGSTAALVIYNKKIIQKIGNFDPKYFAYLEDVDVAFRLHKLGYKTLLNSRAICYHLGGATSNNFKHFRAFYTFRNWFYFIFKNYSSKEIISNLPEIVIERLRNLSYLIRSYHII